MIIIDKTHICQRRQMWGTVGALSLSHFHTQQV